MIRSDWSHVTDGAATELDMAYCQRFLKIEKQIVALQRRIRKLERDAMDKAPSVNEETSNGN
tara:strand:- start:40 stop:225 length:186 start_codon:yes stop_codon:yes gene_type:complete